MNLTLTHLDSAVSAHQSIPSTDPTSGVTVFTGRPGRASDRAFATTQDLLGGFGARPDVSGAGRKVSENIVRIRARLRAFNTRLLVIRHADLLHPHKNTNILDVLWTLCSDEGVSLALTCDDTVGEVLAEWVSTSGGIVHHEAQELIAQLPKLQAHTPRTDERFPPSVPTGDFYIFRTRARELLSHEDFRLVDDLYLSTAQRILANPFGTAQEASAHLQRACAVSDSPAYTVTVLRAAQAAMFRHGVLLKVNIPTFTRLVAEAQHRRLNSGELRALRSYASTMYACGAVLLDAGMSSTDAASLPVRAVSFDGTVEGVALLPQAQELLAIHRHLRDLEGAKPHAAFVGRSHNRIVSDRRLVAGELGLPGHQANSDSRSGSSRRWDIGLGVTMQPLTTQHLPTADQLTTTTKEAS